MDGDDGLPAEEVGHWAKEKHVLLQRYVDITRAARMCYIGPHNAGAAFIDLYGGPGRARVRETGEWIDGSAVAAWKKSQEGMSPFTQVFIGDADPVFRHANVTRLRRSGAPVVELEGEATEAVRQAVASINPYGLHFAFLDPFSLAALDFEIIRSLAALKRIDMLIHLSAMDLQRNLERHVMSEASAWDRFAPGWRNNVDGNCPLPEFRRRVIMYWRDLLSGLKVWPSLDMRMIRGSGNQPLYWLVLAAKHPLAHKLWEAAANVERQGKLSL